MNDANFLQLFEELKEPQSLEKASNSILKYLQLLEHT